MKLCNCELVQSIYFQCNKTDSIFLYSSWIHWNECSYRIPWTPLSLNVETRSTFTRFWCFGRKLLVALDLWEWRESLWDWGDGPGVSRMSCHRERVGQVWLSPEPTTTQIMGQSAQHSHQRVKLLLPKLVHFISQYQTEIFQEVLPPTTTTNHHSNFQQSYKYGHRARGTQTQLALKTAFTQSQALCSGIWQRGRIIRILLGKGKGAK